MSRERSEASLNDAGSKPSKSVICAAIKCHLLQLLRMRLGQRSHCWPQNEMGRLQLAEDAGNGSGRIQLGLNSALNGLTFWPTGPGLRPGIVPCSFAFGAQGLDWRFFRVLLPR